MLKLINLPTLLVSILQNFICYHPLYITARSLSAVNKPQTIPTDVIVSLRGLISSNWNDGSRDAVANYSQSTRHYIPAYREMTRLYGSVLVPDLSDALSILVNDVSSSPTRGGSVSLPFLFVRLLHPYRHPAFEICLLIRSYSAL